MPRRMRVTRYFFSVLIVLSLLSVSASSSLQKHKKRIAAPKITPNTPQPKAAPLKAIANYGQYEFELSTLDGKKIHLSDYAGKIVLVNIWAPWCGPCRSETPGFVKLYDQYHKKGFEIVGVAANTNESDVRSFMQKYSVTWPIGLNDDIPVAYRTYGLPDSYLFKPDGSVMKHFVGFTRDDVIRSFVEEALKDAEP